MILSSSSDDDNLYKIEVFIDNILYYGVENEYVINTLSGDYLKTFIDTYTKRNIAIRIYPIFYIDSSIINLDSAKIDGSYLISYEINTSPDEEFIYKSINNLFSNNYKVNGKEINYLVALYYLGISLKSTKVLTRDKVIEYLYNSYSDSLFGHLEMGNDNTLTRSIILNKITSNGIKFEKYIMKSSIEGEVWRSSYAPSKIYSCNWKEYSSEKYERSTMKLGILLSFSGSYSKQDRELLNIYLIGINFYNMEMKGIRGLIIAPTVYDLKSDINNVPILLELMNSNGINSVMGLSNSEMRIAASETLQRYNMLLFYPHDYEGLECKKNIIYTGIPFTSYSSYRYYIQRDYLQTGRDIGIVYTNTFYYKTAAEIVKSDLEKLGLTISTVFSVNKDTTNMDAIIENINLHLLGNGIIVSLIGGDNKYLFYEAAYKNYFSPPTYSFYDFGIDSSVLTTEYAKYFIGHYLITGGIVENNKISETLQKYNQNYFPYITSFTNDMFYSIISIILWREAIEIKKLYTTDFILEAINNLSFLSPFGMIKTSSNHHISISRFMAQIVEENNSYKMEYLIKSVNKVPSPYSTKYLGEKVLVCNWEKGDEKKEELTFDLFLVLSPKEEQSFLSIISTTVAIINNINSEDGVLGYKLNPVFINYKDGDNTLKSKIENTMIENPLNMLYIGCTTTFCINTITPLLFKYKRLLFYPIKYQAEMCNPYILLSGPIPNQIADSANTFISSLSNRNNIIILYSDDIKWNIFKNIFKYGLESKFNIVLEKEYNDYSYFSSSMVKDLISLVNNGGLIVCFLSEKPLISLFKYLDLIIVDSSQIQFDVFNFRVSPSVISNNLPNLNFPYYYISGLDSPVKNNSFIEKIESVLNNNLGIVDITDDSISVALIIYGMRNIINKAGSVSLDSLKYYLYTTLLIENDSTKFDFNNYLLRDIFIYNYNGKEKTVIRTFLNTLPQPFNWKIPENYGKACDVTLVNDNNNNPITTVSIITVLLVTSTTGANSLDFVGVSEIFQEVVKIINGDGGLSDNQIVYEVLDDTSDGSTCAELIKTYLQKDPTISAIFTTGNQMCVDMVLSSLNEYKVRLYHIGIFGGESCESNVFHFGIEPSALEIIIERVINRGFDDFAIISTSESYHLKFSSYAERYINYFYANIVISTTVDDGIKDCTSIAQNIITKLTSEKSILLLFVNANVHILLSQALKKAGVTNDQYTIYSFSTYENVAVKQDILPFYTYAHYFYSIENQDKEFLNNIAISLPSGVVPNVYHETVYEATMFWLVALFSYGDIKDLTTEYYDINITTATGYMTINSNNIVNRIPYIGYYDGNSDGIISIYSTEDYYEPIVWKQFINTGIYICNLLDPSVGQKYKYPTVTIGVMVSLTGGDKARGRELACSVLLASRIINKDGGLIGSRVVVDIIDMASNFDTLDQVAGSTAAIAELSAVFGATWDDEYKIIIPYFNKVNKLFFFSGIAVGEGCEPYGVIAQETSLQLISISKSTLVSDVQNQYILLYSSHSFSTGMLKLFSNLLDEISVSYEMYEYTSTNNEIFTEIVEKYPDGAKIIDIGSTWYCLELSIQATKAGIVHPKFQVYHYFADEYLINGNEKYFERHIFSGSWFSIIGKEKSKEYTYQRNFYNNFLNYYKDALIVSGAAEAMYASVTLWAKGVKEAFSFESVKVRKGMTGVKFLAGSYLVKLESDNMLSRKFYLVQVVNGKITLIPSPTGMIYPYAFTYWLVENQGKSCNWDLTNNIEYNKNIIRVGLILESDYIVNAEIYNSWLSLTDTLNEINEGGGINGMELYDITRIVPLNQIENVTISLIESKAVSVIFGCISRDCRKIVSKVCLDNKMIFFFIGRSEGDYFSKYTFTISSTIIQRLQVSVEYTTKLFKYYYVIIDEEN